MGAPNFEIGTIFQLLDGCPPFAEKNTVFPWIALPPAASRGGDAFFHLSTVILIDKSQQLPTPLKLVAEGEGGRSAEKRRMLSRLNPA